MTLKGKGVQGVVQASFMALGERQELVVYLLPGFLHPFNLFIESHGFQLSFSFFPGMQRDLKGIKKGCVTRQICLGLVHYLQSSTAPQITSKN